MAAMAAMGGGGCGSDKPSTERARVSAPAPEQPKDELVVSEPSVEKKERRKKPREFVDVLGMDLRSRKDGKGITDRFNFQKEADGLLSEAKERMWTQRFGSSQVGVEKYFRRIVEEVDYRREVWEAVDKYCRHYHVPWEVACGVIGVESGGDNSAVSSSGAYGLFQVKDIALDELQRVKFNEEIDWDAVKLDTVDGNCRAGIAYLRYLYQRYSQWNFALAAYRGGPAAVDASIRNSSKYSRKEEDDAGSFRKFVFQNRINAVFVASENGLGLSDEQVWQYPFSAAVMAPSVYGILTLEEKNSEVEFK